MSRVTVQPRPQGFSLKKRVGKSPGDEVGYRSVTQQGFEVIRDALTPFLLSPSVLPNFIDHPTVPKNILRVTIFDMLLLTKRFSKATVN